MKITFEQMNFLYEMALDTATKTLFVDNQDKHGWDKDEFINALIEFSEAELHSKEQKWVN